MSGKQSLVKIIEGAITLLFSIPVVGNKLKAFTVAIKGIIKKWILRAGKTMKELWPGTTGRNWLEIFGAYKRHGHIPNV